MPQTASSEIIEAFQHAEFMFTVSSEAIDDFAFDALTETLFIQWKSRSAPWYYYRDVDPMVWSLMKEAPSKGTFANKVIKKWYKDYDYYRLGLHGPARRSYHWINPVKVIDAPLDDRRELWTLLHRLEPRARVSYLAWACQQVPGPARPVASSRMATILREAYRCDRADERLTNEVYGDLLMLCLNWKLDLEKAAGELVRRVRRRESCPARGAP